MICHDETPEEIAYELKDCDAFGWRGVCRIVMTDFSVRVAVFFARVATN